MQQWPKSFVLKDEIYQIKDFSRSKVRVLMRLDAARLDLNNPRGSPQGSRFCRDLGENVRKGVRLLLNSGPRGAKLGRSQDPEKYVEAIKWAMGLVDADVTPRPVTGPIRQHALSRNK